VREELRFATPPAEPNAGCGESPAPIGPIRESVTIRFPGFDDRSRRELGPIPFPRPPAGLTPLWPEIPDPPRDVIGQVPSTTEVLDALDNVSRRMESLARSLGCLGYFDDDDDRPRAA